MSSGDVSEQVTTVGPAPALVVTPASPARGTVLLFHGLGGSKDVQRTEAVSLATRGYRAIVFDAVGHGARRLADWDERFTPERGERSYFDLVRRTAEEVPDMLADVNARGWAAPGTVGACGISMGGAVLFGAIGLGCRFAAAATVVASPVWRGLPWSPHQRQSAFFPTALLMETAGADTTVPPGEARALYDALAPEYASAPERLRYLESPGEEHMFTEPCWRRVWSEVEHWFDLHLHP